MTKKKKKPAKKKSCSQVINRDEKGRFPEGVSGNPTGRPTSKWRAELEEALLQVGKRRHKTFIKEIAKWAFADKKVALAVLDKLLPDLKMVKGDIDHTITNLADLIRAINANR